MVFSKEKMSGYVRLARLDKPVGIWLLLWPCYWALAMAEEKGGSHLYYYVLFAVGAVVMRSAGCVINDMWDADFDKKVARTRARPIAAGEISQREALGFLAVLLVLGLVILLQFNAVTILLGFCSVPLIVLYPLMKRVTWWPQAFLGLVFNFGALMGVSAVSGDISFASVVLYASCIFWTLGYDTIYAHQDKEDDALIGVKSTALKFSDKPKVPVVIFYIIQALLLMGVLFGAGGGTEAGFGAGSGMAWLAGVVPVAFMVFVLWRWNPESTESSLRSFKANQIYGALVFLAIVFSKMI